MFIYNTLKNRKEELKKTKKQINIFVCGFTVYDHTHIGHARTYTMFDVIVRYLRSQGYKVFYLQNVTDIDDKIIARAREQKVKPQTLARKFEREYLKDMKTLGITSVDKYARATDYIPQIVKQAQTLIDKGYAYKIKDGYYFDISKFKPYGRLSGRTITQAEDGVSRIDDSTGKRNKGDFCLWKFYKEHEPFWNTKLGKGRPGWHIEDTAITEKHYGPQYDIHGAAADLKFPHHEAEIAQQEAASGKRPFVQIWMHTGFLTINGKKMSKSLKNFITVRDILKKTTPAVLRYFFLSNHYRSPLDYSEESLRGAENTLHNLEVFIEKLRFIEKQKSKNRAEVIGLVKQAERDFEKAMNDDFNTPEALAAIFRLIAAVQNRIWLLSKSRAKRIEEFIVSRLNLFGIELPKKKLLPKKVEKLVKERERFRKSQQFTEADTLRKKIESLGFKMEDTPKGPFVWRSRN